MTEAARKVWREGFVPLLSTAALLALQAGLRRRDPRITQGATTIPRPILKNASKPVQAACPVAYAAWQASPCTHMRVAQLEEHWITLVNHAAEILGNPQATSYFFTWVDGATRDELFFHLLLEVQIALTARAMKTPAA
jgi:hypothetical protein